MSLKFHRDSPYTLSGMTLIELMVSVAIMAVIATGAFQVYSQLQNAHERVTAKTESLNQLQRFWQILQQDLAFGIHRAIRPDSEAFGGNDQDLFTISPLPFSGAAGLMQWTRNSALPQLSSPVPHSELRRVAYGYDDNSIVRYQWSHLEAAADTTPAQMAVLKNVESFSFRFGYISNWQLLNQAQELAALQSGDQTPGTQPQWAWVAQWPAQTSTIGSSSPVSPVPDETGSGTGALNNNNGELNTPQPGQALPALVEITLNVQGFGEITRLFAYGAPDANQWQQMKALLPATPGALNPDGQDPNANDPDINDSNMDDPDIDGGEPEQFGGEQ